MENIGDVINLPLGWRLSPSDEELIYWYLMKKVGCESLPAQVIKEMDANQFYSNHPWDLVESFSNEGREDRYVETERYFFIHGAVYLHGKMCVDRRVGDGIGYWRSNGKEDPITGDDGNAIASKIYSTYYLAKPNVMDGHSFSARAGKKLWPYLSSVRKQVRDTNLKKKHWKMEELRLSSIQPTAQGEEDLHVEEWVVARITRGNRKNVLDF